MTTPAAMEDPIQRLPGAYATFLRLRAEGADDETIAAHLGVPAAALPLLARLARDKLLALPERDDGRAT